MSLQDENTKLSSANSKEEVALALPAKQPIVEVSATQNNEVPAASATVIQIKTKRTIERPTWIEVFTGQAMVVIDKLFEAQVTTDTMINELRKAQDQVKTMLSNSKPASESQRQALKKAAANAEQLEQLQKVKSSIEAALSSYQWTPGKIWLYQWSAVFLLVLCGLAQAFFIELYCQWHGAYFISLNLFTPDNVDKLSNITFVNGPTTLSIAGEVMMWSSLGVWAQQSYSNAALMVQRRFRFADHGPYYIGVMMRNTSVAATIVILLRLAKFSIFGVSLDNTNPFLFDTTIGLSFLLGFFGDDAYRILVGFKSRLMKGTEDKE